MRNILIGLTILAATACTQTTPAGSTEAASTEAMPLEDAMSNCPVIDSRNWHAWVDRMPGPDGPAMRLHVAGQVDLPKPGFEISWKMGIADRMMPPGQQLILELKEPQGIVAQVVSPTDVKYVGPATFERYRFIKIRCGDEIIAEMPDVMITD